MPRQIDCPFCGQTGIRTREHVWAQWLHDTEGAKVVLDGTIGCRRSRSIQCARLVCPGGRP